MYIERTIAALTKNGTGVVVTEPTLWRREGPERLHALVHDQVAAIEELLETEAQLTVVRSGAGNQPTTPQRPRPLAVGSHLNQSLEPREATFVAAAIATTPVATYPGSLPTTTAYTRMLSDDYDAVLVDIEDEPPHYCSRTELRPVPGESLRDAASQVADSHRVPPDTALGTVIETLGAARFRFVGTDPSIEGIVTRFDLNRLPVYLYLFGRFSEFEIGLRRLIRREAPAWDSGIDGYVPHRGDDALVPDRLASAQLGGAARYRRESGRAPAAASGIAPGRAIDSR